jgi:plastocyanin
MAQMRRLAAAAAAALSLLIATPAPAADQVVNATPQNVFSPSSVTIDVNEKVTWNNQGGIHNVVFDDGSYSEPGQPSGSSWSVSRSFPTPGTFRYHCGFHGDAMAGRVTVVDPAAPAPDTAPPRISGLKVAPSTFCNKKTRTCKTTGAQIRFTIDEDARISGRIVRRRDGKKVGSLSITATAGAGEFSFSGKGLRLGKYRLELFPRDAAGNRATKPARANFTVAAKRG